MKPPASLKMLFHWVGWLRPWMLTTLLALGYVLFTLARNAWDPMAFVMIGRQFDPAHGVYEMGYDGQFAYQIALDPAGAAPYLDIPAYRYQRILYPLLARALALGNAAAIPWTLILINLASLALGTLATEKILAGHGRSRWYALAYGAFPGLLLSLRLDLTEPLAFALVQWGVLFFDRQRIWRSLPFFALAVLTRELTLVFAAGCALAMLTSGQRKAGLLWGLAVGLPFGLWQLIMRLWLGSWGIGSGGALASSFELIPFRGWWGYPTQDVYLFVLLSLVVLLMALIPAAAALVASLRSLWKGRLAPGVWILLLNALLFPFLPASTVLNLPGLARITIGLMVAALDYGALESSRRALLYSQMWLFWLVFGEGIMAVH
ncbi:MAG: hypothetical protein D9V45_04725 [Chloroflexi bacterium]|nr:MAG: hypothetical protein D9V45_04725 [Chloroflexota bacterium]